MNHLKEKSCFRWPKLFSWRCYWRILFFKNPKIGDKVVFLDQAHYTLVKTNFFNGINHPEIVLWNSDNNDFKIIKSFDFKDFETRN